MTDTTDHQAVSVALEKAFYLLDALAGEGMAKRCPDGRKITAEECVFDLCSAFYMEPTDDWHSDLADRLASVSSASAEPLTDAQLKDAVSEMLSHRGERPGRILRGGTALWETWVPAFRAGLRYLPAFPEPVPATNQAGEVELGVYDALKLAHDTLHETTAVLHADDCARVAAVMTQCREALALADRLRTYRPTDEWGDGVHHAICTEAADTIAALATQPATSQEGEKCSFCDKRATTNVADDSDFFAVCAGCAVAWIADPGFTLAATPTPPTLSEDLRVLVEALEPFAAACNITTAEDSESLYDSLAAEKLTWRDLRRARAALAQVKAS